MKKSKLLIAPLLVVPFLASCNKGGGDKPGPTVYHTIKFEGERCVMKDDSGRVITQKAFEAGQSASFHLEGETEEFDIPKEENVAITYTATGEKFDGTYSYNAADGSLSVKMTADVTVTAKSEENDPTVTKAEFDAALAFTGVDYLQMESTENIPGMMVGTETNMFSPDRYYSLANFSYIMASSFYDELYACELGTTNHKYIERDDPATPWKGMSWGTLSEDRWMTPQKVGESIKNKMQIGGVEEFDPSKYDPATKSYTLYGYDSVAYTFKFNNKKLVYLDMGGISIMNLTYDKTEIVLPIDPPLPPDPTVTKDEFDAALAFTDVEFLQSESDGMTLGERSYQLKECSPNVYHCIIRQDEENEPFYYEKYTYKLSDNLYKKIERNSESALWGNWEDAAELADWEDPQIEGQGIKNLLAYMEVEEFDPSKYDPDTQSYILKGAGDADFTFKFEDKKIVYIDLAGANYLDYTYDEKTPELPIPAPKDTTVNAEEYEAALSFTDVEYLQVETSTNMPGTAVGTEKEMISPSAYYIVDDMDEYPQQVGPFYDELYAYEVSAVNHQFIERKNSTASWIGMKWDTLSEQKWMTPQKEGESLKAALTGAGVTGYDSFTYDPITESYVHNISQGLDVALKFENKKLVSMDLAGTMESTFEYEKITPVMPINPPVDPQEKYTFTFYESDGTTQFNTMTIVLDDTTEYYSLIFPQHNADEGKWYCEQLFGQAFNPGETVEMPVDSLGNYNFVWTPETL